MQKELEPVARSLPKPPHDRSRFTQKSNHKFAPSPGHFYPNPYVRENGSSASLNLRQELWDNLKEYIESSLDPSSGNNNSTADSFSDKMATSSSSGTKQTASANGYQMPLASAPALPSKSAGFSITPSGHFNNQIVDSSGQPTVRSSHAHVSPNPASMKFLAANQLSQGSVLPQQSQYNQYDTPQEMLLRGYSGPTEDIPGAPRALQYGSQQRWNESTGLNRHTASPFSQPFYAQDSHNSLTGSRSTNSQQEERNMITKQHYHWPQQSHSQAGFGQAGISSNAIPNASVSRTQNEQPGLPSRQPHYNMGMGGAQQQQQQQQLPDLQMHAQSHPYMVKPSQEQSHKYYGGMGANSMGGVPPAGAGRHNQPQQKRMPPEYSSFQQQHMQHRYPQHQVPYPQQRQQAYPPNMPRMPASLPQPILPKPSSAGLYGSPSHTPFASTTPEGGVPTSLPNKTEFLGPMLGREQEQHPPQQQHNPTSYSAGMSHDVAQGGSRPASNAYHPYGAPGQSAKHSPGMPMGSPMRSMAETPNPQAINMRGYPGTTPPPSVGVPGATMSGADSSNSAVPPTSLNAGFGSAAAAAAAVLAAANSSTRFGSPSQSPLEQPHGQSFMPGPHDLLLAGKGPLPGNSTPEAGAGGAASASGPSLHDAAMMGNAETGTVPSPTLNELPTAEDVEAMIESMRAGETSISDNADQPSVHGSAPPSVPSPAQAQSNQSLEAANGAGDARPHGEPVLSPAKKAAVAAASPVLSSMSSPFPGLSPVASPGVSISPTFADGEFDFPLSPSMPPNDASLPYQITDVKTNSSAEKFSELYKLSDEPGRKAFLDHYQVFMREQGSPIHLAPVLTKKTLDLYKFHAALRDRGGEQEVTRKRLWDEIAAALDLPSDANSINFLRSHYAKYLQAYEFRYSKSSPLESGVNSDLLIESSGMPPNAIVTCSEVIIPKAPLGSYSHNMRTRESPFHGPAINDSQHAFARNYDHPNALDEPPLDAGGRAFVYHDGTGRHTPSSPYTPPQYPVPGGERRNSLPNVRRQYSPFLGQQYSPAPSQFSPALGQVGSYAAAGLQQHGQFPQRPSPSSSVVGSPATRINSHGQEPGHAAWGNQFGSGTDAEHMFDYRTGPHGGRASGTPPSQFHPALSYGAYPGRQQAQMQPYASQYQAGAAAHSHLPSTRLAAGTPQQVLTNKAKYHHGQSASTLPLKRPADFPVECVESTRPVFTKKRKLTSGDLGPVEAWRVMMSLKSGLLSETTWALDTLNILLYDDQTVGYFMLAHLPGLLDNLIDHFRRYLIDIFGTFLENEVNVGAVFYEQKDFTKDDNSDSSREERIIKDASRSYTSIITTSSFDDAREGFVSGSSDWIMGGGDTTIHIQSHLGTLSSCDGCDQGECCADKSGDGTSELSERIVRNGEFSSETSHRHGVCTAESCSTECKVPVKQEETLREDEKDLVSKLDAEQEDVKAKQGEPLAQESDSVPGDSVRSADEQLTTQLMTELDLDVDSVSSDPEVESYIKSHVTNKEHVKLDPVEEEEARGKEDTPLCLTSECQDAVSRRCVCVSNILRGLSFVPGNDAEMSRHPGLLLILGRLLLLRHTHHKRVPYRHSYLQEEEGDVDCPPGDQSMWWWHCLEALRENALVIIANVAGQIDLSCYPEAISLPLLDGVLHWSVCKSAVAQDPMPTATPGTSLSPKQLVLEVLAKMSILEGNVDLILATPPASRLDNLYAALVRLLTERDNPVCRELALVLLSNLTQAESSFVSIGDKKPCISTLLEFIEDAASSMAVYSSEGGLMQAGFHTESFCGTSVDMLKRAASTLVCLAKLHANRSLFLPFQERILALATSQVLDRLTVNHLSMVLFYLSR